MERTLTIATLVLTLSAALAAAAARPAAPSRPGGDRPGGDRPGGDRPGGGRPGAGSRAAAVSLSPGDHDEAFTHGGTERKYILHVPEGADKRKPLPLVFVLHGFGGAAQGMVASTDMNDKADREGFFVAYLNGTPCVTGGEPVCHGQWGWNGGLSPGLQITVDDVGYVRDLAKDLGRRLPVDMRRVYAAGFSNGAMMCHRLAAELPDLLAGVVMVEGTIGVKQDDGTYLMTPTPAGAIPVAIVHGKHDSNIPYEGGQGTGAGKMFVKSVDDAVLFWTKANHCNDASKKEDTTDPDVVVTSFHGCTANSDVALFTVVKGVHQWPTESAVGFSATDALWAFFSKHTRS